MEPILVYITAASPAEAQQIADILLDRKLAACVNRVSGVCSGFWWQGERDTADEVLVLAKTVQDRWEALLAAVREIHSYEVFAAIAVPIVAANPEYLAWIRETVAEG